MQLGYSSYYIDDDEREHALAEARAEERAQRRWCAECHYCGTHAPGCPAADDEDYDEDDEEADEEADGAADEAPAV